MPYTSLDGTLISGILTGDFSLFVGAGFSNLSAGYPDVTTLIGDIAAGSEYPSDLAKATESRELGLCHQLKKERKQLLRDLKLAIKPTRGDEKEEEKRTKLRHLITHFPWQSIYTTNYDDLIETELESHPSKRIFAVIRENADLAKLSHGVLPVFKLHGCIGAFDRDEDIPVVITESDFFNGRHRKGRELMYSHLQTEVATKRFLFVGYGRTESTFQQIWVDVQDKLRQSLSGGQPVNSQRHFAISRSEDGPAKRDEFFKAFWDRHNVSVLYCDIHDFMDRLWSRTHQDFEIQEQRFFPQDERQFIRLGYFADVKPAKLRIKLVKDRSRWCRLAPLKLAFLLAESSMRPTDALKIVVALLSEHPFHSDDLRTLESQATAIQAFSNVVARAKTSVRDAKKAQRQIDVILRKMLTGDDVLATYKALAVIKASPSEALIRRVVETIAKEAKEPRLCDPYRSTKPLSRLIRQFLSAVLTTNSAFEFEQQRIDWICETLECSSNPLIQWELANLIGYQFGYDPPLEKRVEHEIRKRREEKYPFDGASLAWQLVELRVHKKSSFGALPATAAVSVAMPSESLLAQRMWLFGQALHDPSLNFVESLLCDGNFSPFSRLSLPALPVFVSPVSPLALQIKMFKMLLRAAEYHLLQPCVYAIWNSLATGKENKLSDEDDALDEILNLPKLDGFWKEPWNRFITVGLIRTMFGKLPTRMRTEHATWRTELLNKIEKNESERLVIRVAACESVESEMGYSL